MNGDTGFIEKGKAKATIYIAIAAVVSLIAVGAFITAQKYLDSRYLIHPSISEQRVVDHLRIELLEKENREREAEIEKLEADIVQMKQWFEQVKK